MEVNMMLVKLPKGMKDFLILWSGQLFSLLGTSMTAFALTLWAWQITGKATSLALVGFFHFLRIAAGSHPDKTAIEHN